MKFNISKEWLLKSADREDEMPVSAGAFTFDMIADNAEEKHMIIAEEPCAYLSVFARLISLRRRNHRLTLEQLADLAQIDLDELIRMEQTFDYSPEPRTVCRLAAALKLPEHRLLQLSGCVEKPNDSLTQQSVHLPECSDGLKKLTCEQEQALDEYIRYLEKDDEGPED